jgi:putative transposase
MAHAPSRLS